MTQIRYHNYRRKLKSFDENLRLLGLAIPGVYSGWDRMEKLGGTLVRFHHDITGVAPTDTDNTTLLNKRGITVSRQGFLVYEDAPIDLDIDLNAANAFTRVDYVIMTHQYLASVGGQSAIYSVVKGALGGPIDPVLPNPKLQTVIGKLYITASAANHDLTVFVKNQVPSLGGYAFNKLSDSDIHAVQNFPLVNDFNAQVTSGILYLENTPLNAPVVASKWTLLIMRSGLYITQMASNAENGKIYSRASVNGGTTWQPWVNMNNPDVIVDFSPITAQIGPRVYTEDNYVVDGQTLTQSVDALDIALKDVRDDLTAAEVDINNLQTADTLKSDKAQPAWANITLVGGATNNGLRVPRYRVTDQGRLEITAKIAAGGTGSHNWGTIPIGTWTPGFYSVRIPIVNETDGAVTRAFIAPNGGGTLLELWIEGSIIGKVYSIYLSVPIDSAN